MPTNSHCPRFRIYLFESGTIKVVCKMLPIKSKIIMASTLVFGVMLIGFAYLVYRSSRQAELLKVDARLESHADKLQSEIEEQYRENQFPDMNDLFSVKTEGLAIVRIQLFDTTGRPIISDSALSSITGNQWNNSFLKSVSVYNLNARRLRFRCHWSPVEIDDRVTYVLQLATPLNEVHENLEHLQTFFFISIPLALLITALAIYFIIRKAFRPITEMVETAQKISATSLQQRLLVPASKDEVRLLAETLNNMIERLDSAFRSQRQFVADASHEIRTPLTIIYSELELAYKKVNDESIKESIQISLSEIDRLSRMANNLLLLAKLDSAQAPLVLEPLRLDELIVECVKLMNLLAMQKNITIDPHIDEAVELSADKDKVKLAVVNILDNAIKYSPENSRVAISLQASVDKPNCVVISITDDGIGIAESEIPRIFKRFYRAEGARSGGDGSGLGLAIARMLIELHGGTISLKSELGKGTSVIIDLPLTVAS